MISSSNLLIFSLALWCNNLFQDSFWVTPPLLSAFHCIKHVTWTLSIFRVDTSRIFGTTFHPPDSSGISSHDRIPSGLIKDRYAFMWSRNTKRTRDNTVCSGPNHTSMRLSSTIVKEVRPPFKRVTYYSVWFYPLLHQTHYEYMGWIWLRIISINNS